MSSLREDITRTILRLSRAVQARVPDRARISVFELEGRELGPYRILRRLGAGGMGQVYLALDKRLGRHAALKFLSPDLLSDPEMLERLHLEARAASSLNHPNILTIYEISEIGDRPFIVSEYVDGATLRVAIERKAVTLSLAVNIVRQVASAMVAAHEAGVVHRDLKPGNIMIRPDGYVKVIDFGLAKTIRLKMGTSGRSTTLTKRGSIIGTLDYMSPEQLRGESVDHRSDLWSLGVILYELLTDRRPFEGETDNHLIVGILDRQILPLPNRDALPGGLPDIVEHALAKNPADRYQSAREMLRDLQEIHIAGEDTSPQPIYSLMPRARRRPRLALAIGATAALLFAGAWFWYVSRTDWFEIESVRQLTFNGRTRLSAISPDGRYLAYVVGDPGGIETVVLKQIEAGTSETVKIPGRRVSYLGITFSADSQFLYEVEEDETLEGKLYAVPLLGDRPAAPLLVGIDGSVSPSPDGTQLAFVNRPIERKESRLEVANSNGSGRHPLLTVKSAGPRDYTILRHVAWSPDGTRIAAFLFSDHSGFLDVVKLNGEEQRKPLRNWRLVGQPCWTKDGRAIVVTAATQTEGNNQAQIRQVATSDGNWRDVTKDLASFRSATMTRDGRELAAVKVESKAALWISDHGDFSRGQSSAAEAEEYFTLASSTLAWKDDRQVIVNSRQSGYPNLWVFDSDTQTHSPLTNEHYVEQGAAPIPGTNSFVFASNRSGPFHIWRFTPETNEFTQLSSGASYDESPAVSPDGKRVLYTSWNSTRPALYLVPATGGPSARVGTFLARNAEFSPDGQKIVCQMQDQANAKWTVAVVEVSDLEHPRFYPDIQLPVRWAPDGRSLTTARTDNRGVSNIWNVPLDRTAPSKLTNFEEQAIVVFSWSLHGDRLACIRTTQNSDVALYIRRR
ncbi:MAG: protein kinase domain-containing protein [Bryobacteraceae bacterium]